MNTRQEIEKFYDAQRDEEKASQNDLHAYARGRRMNLRNNDPTNLVIVEEGKKERREIIVNNINTQAESNDSYKAQKNKFYEPDERKTLDAKAFWFSVQPTLQEKLGRAAYQTWVSTLEAESLDEGILTLATLSSFNQGLIARRYSEQIGQILSELLGETLELRFTVKVDAPQVVQAPQESKPKATTVSNKTRWAATQNPTNNPQVESLLETFGDMRGVILKSQLFKAPCTRIEEGGWGIGVGAMINAGKQYTLEKLLWAIQETKEYRGANDRGKFFFHALRKGLGNYGK